MNLDVEMETGTGKTYTYVKTIYELNARYGWSRFIIVVPSVAVREGVYRSLQTTQEHFAGEYGRRCGFSSTTPTASPRWTASPPTAPFRS